MSTMCSKYFISISITKLIKSTCLHFYTYACVHMYLSEVHTIYIIRMRDYWTCIYKGSAPSISRFFSWYCLHVHTHTSTHNLDKSNVFQIVNLNKLKLLIPQQVKFWKIHVINLFLHNKTLRRHFAVVKKYIYIYTLLFIPIDITQKEHSSLSEWCQPWKIPILNSHLLRKIKVMEILAQNWNAPKFCNINEIYIIEKWVSPA